jgi:hypothetical protein
MKNDPAGAAINRILIVIAVPLACLIWVYYVGPVWHAAVALSN